MPSKKIVKILRVQNKERILKATRKKCHITYKGKSIRIAVELSPKILKSRGA
jgi:hypothetical protein